MVVKVGRVKIELAGLLLNHSKVWPSKNSADGLAAESRLRLVAYCFRAAAGRRYVKSSSIHLWRLRRVIPDAEALLRCQPAAALTVCKSFSNDPGRHSTNDSVLVNPDMERSFAQNRPGKVQNILCRLGPGMMRMIWH